MVEDEVNGNNRHDGFAGPQHCFVHYFNPGFLRQDLKHGHESLA
jgi:hypothetical protein